MLTDASAWLSAFNDNVLKEKIIEWIQIDQLTNEGVDENGEVIGYYSWVTSKINTEKIFNSHYTLDDSGAFYRSMVVTAAIDSITIDADSEKMEDQEWWRDEILGLTDQSMEKLRDEYRARIISYARRVLLDNL